MVTLTPRNEGNKTWVVYREGVGRYWAAWKREFKLPWCKAGPLKSSRRLSGFGAVGCQKRTLSRWRSRGADRRAVQWGNPYIAYPQYSTSPNVARRARSQGPKFYGLPMPLRSTTPNVACYLRVSHATLRVTPLYHTRDTSLFATYSSNSTTSSNRFSGPALRHGSLNSLFHAA